MTPPVLKTGLRDMLPTRVCNNSGCPVWFSFGEFTFHITIFKTALPFYRCQNCFVSTGVGSLSVNFIIFNFPYI